MDLRLPRAQLVIFLDLPRSTYFPSAVWRSLRSRGRQRPDIGPGCVERFDPAFFRDWVWTYPSRGRPKAIALMAALPLGVRGLTFTSRRAVRRLIATLPGSLDGA
jgi:adenylate kinase family enzyme